MRIIIFKDNTTKVVSKEDEEKIFLNSAAGKKGILLKDGYISFDSISRTLDEDEYYRQKPEKRILHEPIYPLALPPGPPQMFSREKHLKHLEKMREEFVQHFNGRELPAGSLKVLVMIDKATAKVQVEKKKEYPPILPSQFFGLY